MSKIVTKFRYYKPKSRDKKGGYAKYIATRDGVEKINNTPPNSPTTLSQQELIKQLLFDFPDSIEMLEYADYLADPTVAKASEFIARAIEDNANEVVNRTTYADYIAMRPRAERLGKHGLFSDAREEIDLNQVSDTLNEHQGNMWTMIVSLRREDAERLNYNTADAWRTLMQKHAADLADALKIPFSDLKWYGAFHNESHHPHIHVIAYTEAHKVVGGVEFVTSMLPLNHYEAVGTQWDGTLYKRFDCVDQFYVSNKDVHDKCVRILVHENETAPNREDIDAMQVIIARAEEDGNKMFEDVELGDFDSRSVFDECMKDVHEELKEEIWGLYKND